MLISLLHLLLARRTISKAMQDGQDETIDLDIDIGMVLSDLSDSSRQQHRSKALSPTAGITTFTSGSTADTGISKRTADGDEDVVIIGPESRPDPEDGHVFGGDRRL
ncbi:hypothetical protein HD553DRAFT_315445 [Filobasidium floriforme]|uniref:uncharacterized protein n=1 Tax=Filobasidium floriforme TaxID=5210 RepID=UPI001E8E13DF|nr:uncharacterized protein HD553DRAFT_315445 [Filobasidium floriforme]KAH8081387.1 hypothetical protein HD553DRAFT_315445 [Filobasidium floriforme]